MKIGIICLKHKLNRFVEINSHHMEEHMDNICCFSCCQNSLKDKLRRKSMRKDKFQLGRLCIAWMWFHS